NQNLFYDEAKSVIADLGLSYFILESERVEVQETVHDAFTLYFTRGIAVLKDESLTPVYSFAMIMYEMITERRPRSNISR
ncbi:15847_t:CDS:1, partial [Racocetra persica]